MPAAGPLSVRIQVGWGDCDPAGIVFYPRFYAWMDAVSHHLAREMGVGREAMIAPSTDLLGFPVVSTQAQFFKPARVDDILDVRGWVTRVGRSSLGLRHEIVRVESDGGETVVVRGREERVFIAHTHDGLQPRQLTPPMRQALARFVDPDTTTPFSAGSDGFHSS